jgi:hypothetical protein
MTAFGKSWSQARPTKSFAFWFTVTAVVVTLVAGFTWGGWMTRGTAQAAANDAVVKRLASICVATAREDPATNAKLKVMRDSGTWERADYVRKQGWATMPGDKEPDHGVAEVCAGQLAAE